MNRRLAAVAITLSACLLIFALVSILRESVMASRDPGHTQPITLSAPVSPLLINEIRIDQPGGDYDEYFEISGPPGLSLDDYTYLVLGDEGGSSGVIECAVSLAGATIPFDANFLAAEDNDTFGAIPDLLIPPDGISFESSDNLTHLLVRGFTATLGTDLDTDDDGTLDIMPWAELIDLIALIEEDNPPSGTEYHYGPPTVGPDGLAVPGYVFRCDDHWIIGPFDPVGGDDTPGYTNMCYDAFIDKDGPFVLTPDAVATYTIAYSNTGLIDLFGVQIVDYLPSGVTYVADTSGLACPACIPGASGPLTWSVPALYTITNSSFDLVVHIPSTASGYLTNTVAIIAPRDDYPFNNTDFYTTRAAVYDLEVSKSSDTTDVLIETGASEQVTYTIQVTNYSTATATTVVTVTDILPLGFVYVSDDSGVAPAGTGTPADPLQWVFVSPITPSSSLSFNLVVSVTDAITTSGLYHNSAAIDVTPVDLDLSNNAAQDDGIYVWRIISIAAARALPLGAHATVMGTVTAQPGVYSNYTMFIQDSSGGIEIYQPAVSLTGAGYIEGDVVVVTGVRDAVGVQRLETTKHMEVGTAAFPAPLIYNTGTVADSTDGWWIQIAGTVSGITTVGPDRTFYVDDGSGAVQVLVDASSPGLVSWFDANIINGDRVVVRGIAAYYFSTVQVWPRYTTDIIEYPRVLSTGPVDGATDALPTGVITAQFNLPMTNVGGGTFLLDTGAGPVAGSIGYNGTTKIASFTPLGGLNCGTTYTATLAAALEASNGLTLTADYVWSFDTVPCLVVDKTVSTASAAPGDPITYYVSVQWNAPGATLTLTDTLPSELDFLGATLPAGWGGAWNVYSGPVGLMETVFFTITTQVKDFEFVVSSSSFHNTVTVAGPGVQSVTAYSPETNLSLIRFYLPLAMRNG